MLRSKRTVVFLLLAATLSACTTQPRPFSRATRPPPLPPAWSPDPSGTPVDKPTADDIHASAVFVFRYRADGQRQSSADVWTTPEQIERQIKHLGYFVGDCEDFATWCVHLARRRGLPARLVVCLTEALEPHCVADVGGWVLCNRQPAAVAPQALPYTWIKASGYHPGDPWTRITLAPPDPANGSTTKPPTKPATSGLFY